MKKRVSWIGIVLLLGMFMVIGTPQPGTAKTVIKIAFAVSLIHTEGMQSTRFKEIVEKGSNGEIEVQIFPSGQMGSNTEMFQAVQMGGLQISTQASSVTTPTFPESGLFDLPFLFRDFNHADHFFDGPDGQAFSERFRKKLGIRILGYSSSGFQGFYNNKRPIKTLEDIKGLKMRVMESPVLVDAMNAYGAKAVAMSMTEFYNAMQQGVVDGGENGIVTYETQKHYEVAKYFADSRHKYLPIYFIINDPFLQKLPPDHQKLVIDAGYQSAVYARQVYSHEIEEKTKRAVAGGAMINKLNPGAEKDFQKALEPVYKKYLDRIQGGKDVIEAIKRTQ
jgi:TRAP-type transport system periplasmic protein